MGILLKIAWRNILRNKKRSFITISAVTFGLTAMVFLWSFSEGAYFQMSENIKTMITGDLQVYAEGAAGLYNVNQVIEDPRRVETALKAVTEIKLLVPRVVASGLISSATKSLTTFVVGSEPDSEKELSEKNYVVTGRALQHGDEHAIVIGKPMATQLEADIGDKVVLVAQDRYGSLTGEAFRIVGIFETGSDQIDHTTVHLWLPVAQRILSYDQAVTKFLVRLKRDASLEAAYVKIEEALQGQGLQISRWQEVAPMLAQLVEFDRQMILIILIIVITVVSAGVLNTLVMSFVERIREFGLMKALGTQDAKVAGVVLFESLFLTLVGCLVGIGSGLALAFYFQHQGVDLSGFSEGFSNLLIGTVIYPLPRLQHVLITMGVVLGANLLVSLYPAWRASRLEPVEAMRQVG